MALASVPNLAKILFLIVFIANTSLLIWIGADAKTLIGSCLIQAIWTLGGSLLIVNYRSVLRDSILFYLCAYALGLCLFFLTGFIALHRELLGETPHMAALFSLAPLAIMALIRVIRFKNDTAPTELVNWNSVAILLTASFLVAAIGTYGFGNNEKRIKINDPTWTQQQGLVPLWAWQGDREVHYQFVTLTTFEEGFPPRRINHRGFHVSVLFVTLLTGEMSKSRVMVIYKTMSLMFFFILTYGLYSLGKGIFGLSERTAVFVASSALVFSPLKLPLFELTPTYIGFIAVSGGLYHSDTQYTSLACSTLGLFLILVSLKTRQRTFFLGCCLVVGGFFLKPVNFIILAPAAYAISMLCWRDFNRDRFAGLAILLAVPVVWFSYIYVSGMSSNFDGVLQRSELDLRGNQNLGFQPSFFGGYLPYLQGRFPVWIDQSPLLTALSMTVLSFAAFWVAGLAALQRSLRKACRGLKVFHAYLQENAHIYFQLGFFVLAILLAIILGDDDTKNMNWGWSASSAYILCLPLFAKGITLIKQPNLRAMSWGLYGVQTAQGIGYLFYFFWYSKMF